MTRRPMISLDLGKQQTSSGSANKDRELLETSCMRHLCEINIISTLYPDWIILISINNISINNINNIHISHATYQHSFHANIY